MVISALILNLPFSAYQSHSLSILLFAFLVNITNHQKKNGKEAKRGGFSAYRPFKYMLIRQITGEFCDVPTVFGTGMHGQPPRSVGATIGRQSNVNNSANHGEFLHTKALSVNLTAATSPKGGGFQTRTFGEMRGI